MADELSILLTLEAVDKASSIIHKVEDAMSAMSENMLAATQRVTRSAADQQLAQERAAAASMAYERAITSQSAAQAELSVATAELTRAQEAYARAASSATGATAAEAAAVDAAAAQQVAALDALRAAEIETTARSRQSAEAQAGLSTSLLSSGTAMKATAVASAAVAVGVAAIATASINAAGDFQASMLRMYTSAGESKGAIDGLSKGVLQMSVDTATGTDELAKGLYFVESAGYHANDALKILRAGAEGARAEGADLAEVTNALTTVMKDYNFQTDEATKVTDMMVAAVGNGKMTMQQFSTSLSTVLPTAKSAKISFEEVAGAIATMTAQGITAQQATVDLNHLILKLEQPTQDSTKYMAQLGLDAQDVSSKLGERGLTGTVDLLTKAIASHVQGGKVLVDSFNQSKSAGQDMQLMLKSMPPDLRKISEQLENGSLSFKEYKADIMGMAGPQHAMGAQFLALASQADGFNQLIKSGSPAALEYTAALKKLVGDQTSLQSILALSNGGMGSFVNTVGLVAQAANEAGDHVKGWDEIQETFNFKMAKLHDSIHAIAIGIGTALLPVVSEIADKIGSVVSPIVNWIEHHQKLTATIVIVTGVLAALVAIVSTVIIVSGALAIAIEAVGAAFGTIMAATGVGLVIMALGVAAFYVATHWKQTKEVLAEVWHWIVDQAKAVADFFVGVWHDVVKMWDEVWAEIGGTVKKWWPLILAPVTGGMSIIVGIFIKYRKEIGDAFSAIWDWLVSVWDASGGKLVSYIAHGWSVVSESVSKEWHRISDDLAQIWSELGELWNATGGKLVHLIASHWDQISNITSQAWHYIYTLIKQDAEFVWSVISSVFKIIWDTFRVTWDIVVGIVKIAWDLIWSNIKGSLDLIWGIIKAAFDLIWGALKVTWDSIILIFELAWDIIKGVINTALDLIKGILRVFIDIFTGDWGRLWSDIWNTAKTFAKDIWDIITTVFSDLWRWLKAIGGDLWDAVAGAWNSIYKGVSQFVSNIWDGIKSAFKDGLSALGNIWNDLKRLAADPVNFVIDAVYNNGIRTLWNDVSGVFGGPQLGRIGHIAFAEGGPVPGVGNTDSVPAMLMPGEFVLSHKMIDAMGGIANVISAFGTGNNDGTYFKGGGLVSTLFNDVKSAYNWGKDVSMGALRNTAQSAFNVVNNILNEIPGGNTGMGREMINGVYSLENGILGFLGKKDKEAPRGYGDPLDTWVRQAISATRASIGWFSGLESIAMNESGGNPNAINNWDINAQNGDPSRGLMQTIGATFRAYHQAGTSDNIFDPVANVAAAINYIRTRYHDINNVPGLRSMASGGPYVGYENGTWDTGSFARMALLHPHEAVLPAGVAGGLRGGGLSGGNSVVFNMQGMNISSTQDRDRLIAELERRIVVRLLPSGGVRIRM